MKRKYRVLVISICVFLLLISLTVLAATVYITVFSNKNIDSENDERLFALARGGSITEYYIDKDASCNSISDYNAEKYESLSLGEIKKVWIPISEVNDNVINGFIAMEDRKFYSHSGFDIKRTLYALSNSLFHFKSTFGASTITQQVIKNISGDNEITLKRKLAEIIRAYNIEKRHSKDEILELYINIVPMGENLCGIAAASEAYFGKKPSELTLSEAATLVGITNAPTRYNPHSNPDECKRKRNDVLYSMYDFGVITEGEYIKATESEIEVLPMTDENKESHSWFIETVNADVTEALMEKYQISKAAAEALLYSGGLKIYTTENPLIQNKLEAYFENTANFPNEINDGLDFSMVICDSSNGNLLGIVGAVGKKEGDRLLNLALTPSTPGSAMKPIALYAPLINSGKINWATVFDDVPIEFNTKGYNLIEYPQNYPKVYDGLINVKDALRLSKNTVAVRLYNMLGAEEIYRSLKQDFGFDTLVRKKYSENGNMLTDLAPSPLALGQLSYGVSLRKLTEAYTVFPSDGILTKGRSFIAVYDSEGNLIIDNSPDSKEVFSKECARIMNKLLMNVTGTGTASKITLKNTVDVAGKTGTSGDDKDRLFIGYTPYLTAGIWCGYRDGERSINKNASAHVKIWDEIMKDIHNEILEGIHDSEVKNFSADGLVKREYCKDSGKLYSPNCKEDPRGSRLECGYFMKSSVPKGACDRHILCYYDTVTEGLATHACPEENLKEISLLLVNNRHFPKEIIISDAEYVYFEIDGSLPLADTFELPFYYNYIAEGDYVGRGRRRKQFNSSCYLHDE